VIVVESINFFDISVSFCLVDNNNLKKFTERHAHLTALYTVIDLFFDFEISVKV